MLTPPTLDEAEVRLAAAGDRSAYERLVRRCSGLVSALALAVVGDVVRSEDVAQEVFVAAWKDLSRLRNPRTFLPWLRGMTRHLALRTLRDKHVPTEAGVLASCADERAGAAERLERAEDPKAEARQRRERWLMYGMFAYANFGALGSMALMTWAMYRWAGPARLPSSWWAGCPRIA